MQMNGKAEKVSVYTTNFAEPNTQGSTSRLELTDKRKKRMVKTESKGT